KIGGHGDQRFTAAAEIERLEFCDEQERKAADQAVERTQLSPVVARTRSGYDIGQRVEVLAALAHPRHEVVPAALHVLAVELARVGLGEHELHRVFAAGE